jgi:hypothetical protein
MRGAGKKAQDEMRDSPELLHLSLSPLLLIDTVDWTTA